MLIELLLALLTAPGLALASGDFKVRLLDDPLHFDWNLAYGKEAPILMNMMEGLVEFDKQMKIAPALAQEWTVSADGKTYDFKLRPGVKWSDGKPLVAADFVFSWLRLLSPSLGASYAYLLFDIEGAEDYHAGKLKNRALVGVSAIGTDKIQLRLRSPKSFFLQLFSFWSTFPVRQDLVEKFGPAWEQPGKIVVLGPFVPVSYVPHSQIVMKRNELYHGDRPRLDSVTFKIINEESNALKAFAAGEVDYSMFYGTQSDVEDSGILAFLKKTSIFKVCSLYFNVSIFPFSLKKIRQAFAMAIDRTAIAQKAAAEAGAADAFAPTLLFPAGKGSTLPFDPAKAKQLLGEAIGEVGKLPKLEFTIYASDQNARLGAILSESLERNLGVKLAIGTYNMPEYHNRISMKIAPIFYGCWAADYADPDSIFSVFLSDTGNNRTFWKNAAYDALIHKGAATADAGERARIYVEAQKLLLQDEAAIIPLYFPQLQYFLKPKFTGLSVNAFGHSFFRNISEQ
ncbi:MAG: peptide ABC transporter substrate-binding protein [Deltaproteobacteria bacterium]|nr:peptide ABC transporter substrate-binding protein [Deltaproteobacteria bacterium]